MEENKNPFVLSGASLDAIKLIGMLLMILDHANESMLGESYEWMSVLGRGAFPLFAYAMACSLLRRSSLERYLQRLVVFALVSQPVFVLAFSNNSCNVLFTLSLGAVVGVWVVGQPIWRRHAICVLAMTSFVFPEVMDFGLVGVVLPGMIACVLDGDRRSWGWLVLLGLMLNLGIKDFVEFDDGDYEFLAISGGDFLTVLASMVLPFMIVLGGRLIEGRRFLHRYALYVFYPGHLFLLAAWRWWSGNVSMSFFFS